MKMNKILGLNSFSKLNRLYNIRRYLTKNCIPSLNTELTIDVKHDIEEYWSSKLHRGQFDASSKSEKFYVLSMFPYPSGNLHMGHVRVYTISDAIARFYRMSGKNVFHPIGWDAFGLPAENAAIQRNIDPATWTAQNTEQMRQHLKTLGCSFDWSHELSTCSPEYYRWTQQLFLKLYKEGLVYQNEALVNWDPVDKTVLADEQVNEEGRSWRSGAKVEKKLLKQWFIRTSAFAKRLLDGLESPVLQEWRDIIKLQSHWIGECDGYSFMLLTSASNLLRVWTRKPEYLKDSNAFIVLKSQHYLSKLKNSERLTVENPFAGTMLPVVFSDDAEFAEKCDVYLAAPSYCENDKELQERLGMPFTANVEPQQQLKAAEARAHVLEAAKRLRIGGYPVSSKLQDWLISRQRFWGTPIPMVKCSKCGSVPVKDEDLPVLLAERSERKAEALACICPKCGSDKAHRETDTMDTFVDSSWYYLRYLDHNNVAKIFDEGLVNRFMPVDLYIGGKEHAVLHLYYARFMNHFLHSVGLIDYAEPFSRLLVQGMVMGRSYRIKGDGRYVKDHEVEIVNAKKNQARLKDTKQPVVMSWEKMSKSKLNGVEPTDMFRDYGTDTTRLIILADVAPTSHRNWSTATFPGILNWQNRLWLTVKEFCESRESRSPDEKVDVYDSALLREDLKLYDARNFYVKGATFNYRHTHQLSVAISKMQGLTNSLRRAPKDVIQYGMHYERALASQLIMLAPMAPHFASELWSNFVSAPHRINTAATIDWHHDALEQKWPKVDLEYPSDLTIKINGFENCIIKVPRCQLDKITSNDAMDIAFNTHSVTSYLKDKKILNTNFVHYPELEAILNIYAEKLKICDKKVEQLEHHN